MAQKFGPQFFMVLMLLTTFTMIISASVLTDGSLMYMQSTSLMNESPSQADYIAAFALSGVIHCENICTNVNEFQVQSNSFGKDIDLTFDRVDQLVIRTSNGLIMYKQEHDVDFHFIGNQLKVRLHKDKINIDRSVDIKNNNPGSEKELPPLEVLRSTELIIEFKILVLKKPAVPTPTWFGEVNVVVTTTQISNQTLEIVPKQGDNETEVSVYRLVTLGYFENSSTETVSPFSAYSTLSHTIKPVISEPEKVNSNQNNTHQPIQDDSKPQPTIILSTYWKKFPFSFDSKPAPQDFLEKYDAEMAQIRYQSKTDQNSIQPQSTVHCETPTTPTTINDDPVPTVSLSYALYELTGPFGFVLNPDQTTLDIPCLINALNVVTFQLTPNTLLLYFSEEIKHSTMDNDSITLICPKWLVTSRFTGQAIFHPASPKIGLSVYFYTTPDNEPSIPDEYFVPTNAQYSHARIVDILSDLTVIPYSLNLQTIHESSFIYQKVSVLYQNYYNIPLPGPKESHTFDLLPGHRIDMNLVGGNEFSDDVYHYLNPIDTITNSPWGLQLIHSKPLPLQDSVSLSGELDKLVGKVNITSFSMESFAYLNKTRDHLSNTNDLNGRKQQQEQQQQHKLSILKSLDLDTSTLTSPIAITTPPRTGPYSMATYHLTAPTVDSSSVHPWEMLQVPYTQLSIYNPVVENFKIVKHPFCKQNFNQLNHQQEGDENCGGEMELKLQNLQFDLSFLEISFPRLEFLRFNGEFKCQFSVTEPVSMYNVLDFDIESENQEQNISPDHRQLPTKKTFTFNAVAGTYQNHETTTKVTDSTSLFFDFSTDPIESTNIDTNLSSQPTTHSTSNNNLSTPIIFKNGSDIDIKCGREGKLTNYLPAVKSSTNFVDFLTLRSAPLPSQSQLPSQSLNDIVYYQTSAIYKDIKPEPGSGIGLAVICMILVLIAGLFFTSISQNPHKSGSNDMINPDSSVNNKPGIGSYTSPLLSSDAALLSVDYDDGAI